MIKSLLERLTFLVLVLTLSLSGVALAIGGGDGNPDLKTSQESLERWRSLRVGTFKGITEACLEYDLGTERTFSRAILFEGNEEAQYARIRHIQIQAKINDKWETVKDVKAWGAATPEYDMWAMSISTPEIRFSPTTARFVRLKIVRATDSPVIHEFKLYER